MERPRQVHISCATHSSDCADRVGKEQPTAGMISLLLLVFIASVDCSVHWAVKVDGGIEVAEQIAKENGFNFLGKVTMHFMLSF